jgi:endoglucanase
LGANEDDWLHVEGTRLVDAYGFPARMTGANWFGYTTQAKLYGLDVRPMREHVQAMAEKGINVLRIPITTELTLRWKAGDASVADFDSLVAACAEFGVKMIIDMHGALQDPDVHKHPVWFKGVITVDKFYEGWRWLAEKYKNNDTVIAFDLKNEPHGWKDANPTWDPPIQPDPSIYSCWGNPNGADPLCPDAINWAFVAKTAADQILAIHPNILIVVEGVEVHNNEWFWWGGNLSGVQTAPIKLNKYQQKLVYSPHVYGPAVYDGQAWFKDANGVFDFTKAGLYARKWQKMFGFIQEQSISHLFFGEWGGATRTTDGDGRFAGKTELIANNLLWMKAFAEYIIEINASHTWWAYNPNSNDTGGLVANNWRDWDTVKYSVLEPTLWKINGQFVGLDHRKRLGLGTNIAVANGVNPDVKPGSPGLVP